MISQNNNNPISKMVLRILEENEYYLEFLVWGSCDSCWNDCVCLRNGKCTLSR